MNQPLYNILASEGYFEIREIPGRGYCGLTRLIFTVALCFGLDESGYFGRYCYPDLRSAIDAIREWDGIGDPPGEWIKYKGFGGERRRQEDKSKTA